MSVYELWCRLKAIRSEIKWLLSPAICSKNNLELCKEITDSLKLQWQFLKEKCHDPLGDEIETLITDIENRVLIADIETKIS